jgi:hypothetical protein
MQAGGLAKSCRFWSEMTGEKEIEMSVYLAILVAAFASAYLLLRLSRFLTSRSGLQKRRKIPAPQPRQTDRSYRKPAKTKLKPALMRKAAPAKRRMGKTGAVYQRGTIRKPWGW